MFSLAVQADKLTRKPHIPMLQERNTRVGFFEPEQLDAVLAHLPEEIQPVIQFAAITGWRIASEVLPLEWRQVDMAAGEVRLDAHTTKNGDGRVFPFTADLRALLKARRGRARPAEEGRAHLPVRLLPRGRGRTWRRKEAAANPQLHEGVAVGVSRSGLSRPDPARPATHCRPHPGPRRHSRTRRDAADRAQDAERVRALRHRQRHAISATRPLGSTPHAVITKAITLRRARPPHQVSPFKFPSKFWRRRPDLNRGWRFCRAIPGSFC